MLGLLLMLHLMLPSLVVGQLSTIRGRVMDRETGEVVRDATVALEGTDYVMVSDEQGLFEFPEVPAGEYRVRVGHLAYGQHTEAITLEADAVVALRILISLQAIELDPIVVEAMTQRERDQRSRGTMIHEVTLEEVERAARTSHHLGDVLRQTVPGLQVRDTHTSPGARICIEFRGRRSVRFSVRCQTPVLLLDGVRMYDPPSLYGSIDVSSIARIEVIPPSEAGLLYGSDSAFGIILIETRVWAEREDTDRVPRRLRGGVYDWTLEVESHSWKKVFITSALGNALGVVAGLAVAGNCIKFESLARDVSATKCDSWPTAASWAAAFGFPLFGAGLGARYAGTTPVSRGSLIPALSAGVLTLIPAYALASSAQLDGVSPTRITGFVLLGLGVPAAVTAADYLFRKLRSR